MREKTFNRLFKCVVVFIILGLIVPPLAMVGAYWYGGEEAVFKMKRLMAPAGDHYLTIEPKVPAE